MCASLYRTVLNDPSPVCPAGILFSTLVFGPACGFILGSVCTKVYVDAVFIDTSEFEMLCTFRNAASPHFNNTFVIEKMQVEGIAVMIVVVVESTAPATCLFSSSPLS